MEKTLEQIRAEVKQMPTEQIEARVMASIKEQMAQAKEIGLDVGLLWQDMLASIEEEK